MRLGRLSVRVRLTLWYALALAALVLTFALGVYYFVRRSLLTQVEDQLQRDLAVVRNVLVNEPIELVEIEQHSAISLFQVTSGKDPVGNDPVYRTAGWQRARLSEAIQGMPLGMSRSWTSPAGRFYFLKTATASARGHAFQIVVAQDGDLVQRSLQSLKTTLLLGFPCILALAGLGGYWLAGRVLSPVDAMAAKAQEITAERLSERLPVENPHDEFGRLATVFNNTLARLQESFEQLRRFTADASHELRTPLTALRSVGEVGLRNTLPLAGYREVIGSMLEEAEHLTHLVDSLLMLTRAESGRVPLHPEPVDLNMLAQEVADFLRVLAEEKNQTLSLHRIEGVTGEADRATLRQAFINLLDNAIKYTPPGGHIRIVVSRLPDGSATVEVQDSGPGIPQEHHAQIFDRFYRVEQGRSRETGGAGLGLAIARWAVEANGGYIQLESKNNEGSLFRIVLPSPQNAQGGSPHEMDHT